MEEHMNPLAVTHLLQHTLRSLCIHDNSQWVYAVFWRILPRNYPPPKWDGQGAYDRSRGNRRNWILVWEDGFCNFAASTAEMNSSDFPADSSLYGNREVQHYQGLQPELFFKMSHEIYNYGEGLIGKVAADHSHKWINNEPNNQEINLLSTWNNSADSHPRTWEAQFQSGIKTIALIAVREGVIQLGGVHKVIEDLSYVVLLRKTFGYIESIPGVLLPHPSSSPYPYKLEGNQVNVPADSWYYHQGTFPAPSYEQFNQTMNITPSMSSLDALLSKLPSVIPQQPSEYYESQSQPQHMQFVPSQRHLEQMGVEKATKEEMDDHEYRPSMEVGESSNAITMSDYHQHHNHRLNITSSMTNDEY